MISKSDYHRLKKYLKVLSKPQLRNLISEMELSKDVSAAIKKVETNE